MSGSRLALVADDSKLTGAIASSLKQSFDPHLLQTNFTEIRGQVGPETDGVLLLATASAADAKQARKLVQEISLQKWPPVIILVEGHEETGAAAGLDEYVVKRFRWPD